jgi:hypothetical protein
VSYSQRGFVFHSPENFRGRYPRKFRHTRAQKAFRCGDELRAIVSEISPGFSSKTATKIGEISRVADLGDEPRFGAHIWGLVRNR